MRQGRITLIIRLSVLAISCAVTMSEAAPMLRVRPHVVASPNSEVKLSQLVDSQGISAELQTQISNVVLVKAPAQGERIELANASLSTILRPLMHQERERANVRVNLIIPKTVVIDTLKRGIESNLVQLEILQTWQPLCIECQLEIESLSLPRIADIQDWTLRLRAELPRGSFSIPVDLVRTNGSMTSAWVSGRLIIKRKVPVAKRVIGLFELANPQDFNWEMRDTSFAIDGVPAAEEMAGQRLKQGLRANDILWKGMLEKEKSVRRGDLVQLKSSEGSWEVSIRMIAQQDAVMGDVIHLKNPKTNSTLMGQVVGQGEVQLR